MKNNKSKMSSFSAVVETPYDGDVTIDVNIPKNECELTYDEVEDAIYQKLYAYLGISEDDLYDEQCCMEYDGYKIVSIVINDGDESYPVVSEDNECEAKNSQVYDKYLVLPWAQYALTPECKLWINLKTNGLIDEDAPFDFEKYHKILSNS